MILIQISGQEQRICPIPRSWFATCTIDGKIYAMGGWLVDNAVTKTVEVYDPVQDILDKEGGLANPKRRSRGVCDKWEDFMSLEVRMLTAAMLLMEALPLYQQ